jgi:hypothetical protein
MAQTKNTFTMKIKLLLPLLCCTLYLISCGDDDTTVLEEEEVVAPPAEEAEEEETVDPAVVFAAERETSITTLTNGASKVWRINSATLNNANGTFDIGNNFNVLDDEFIFARGTVTGKTAFQGSLEWRQGNIISFSAGSAEEAKFESYTSPQTFNYDFETESSSALLSEAAKFNFTISSANELIGTITFSETATLDVSLTEKLATDYKQVPIAPLNFSEAFTFESNNVSTGAPGMVGSLSDQSFFFATREAGFNNGTVNPERIIRFDLNTTNTTEVLNFNADFVTKQMNILNNKLYVAGGQRINIYDLKLQNEPVSLTDYGTALGLQYFNLSRHGTAVTDNTIYLIGGNLDNTLGDKIFAYDLATETMTEFATMPEPRTGARAEIVNGKLYVFGGTESFLTPPAKNTIYIYDMKTRELTIENMPNPVLLTYTGKIENLIYVGGRNQTQTTDENGETIFDQEPFLGIYDTTTKTFTELETNLESEGIETIHSMAVFDNKLFVIYGQWEAQEEGQLQTWSILSAGI